MLSPAQQLYASAGTPFTPPTLSAPSMPFLTPPSSPHHDLRSQSYRPASPSLTYNHSGTPMLTTKAEAPKNHQRDSQVHTTAVPSHVLSPRLQVHFQLPPSPWSFTSSTTPMTASVPVYPQ
ncbi:hypothetical protein H2248_000353 [Termitomyces sp. 'cryptogamus']|nr:hypothetical protein H2248_000353 [Termitomyces sp. 'cryptogamus']